jgi:hypothetical protein
MAKEGDNRGVAERGSEAVRNLGILGIVAGALLWFARQPIGADIVVLGAVAAGGGELGRQAAATSNKKK